MSTQSDKGSMKPVEAPVLTMAGWRLYILQFCLLFCLTLSVMDSSAVSTALVSIGEHFNDTMNIQWVVLSYILADLGFSMIFSRLSDILGRKWTVILALVIITAGSIGCGCSQTLNQLIAFRTLQGLGGAGLYSVPLIVLPEITPVKQFRILGALIGIAITVSAVVGPTLGGVIVTHSTWRWVFWFNIPCGALIIALMLLFCPNFDTFGKISWTQIDILGCAAYIAISFLPVFALQEAGAGTFSWSSPGTIICFVLTGVCIVFMFFWIPFLSKKDRKISPLFPAHIAKDRVMASTIMVSGLVGYSFYTILVELPERFQIVNDKSAEMSGIYLLAVSGASALGSGVGPSLSMRKNHTVPTVTAGCCFLLLGLGLMFTVGANAAIADKIFGFEIITGFGLGLVVSTTTVMIKLSAKVEDAAAAQGLMSQSRLLGGNFALAIATVVLNKHLSKDLQGIVPSGDITLVRHSLTAVKNMNFIEQLAVRESFVNAFKTELEICMIVTGVAIIFCGLTWQKNPATVEDKLIEAGVLPDPANEPTAERHDMRAAGSTSTLQTVGENSMLHTGKPLDPMSSTPSLIRQPSRVANHPYPYRSEYMTEGDYFPDVGQLRRPMPPIAE